MNYTVLVNKQVLKTVNSLPKSQKKMLMEILKISPIPTEHFDIKKLKGFENVFRVRIGEYRLIYALLKEDKIIKVIKLEPRGRVYK